MNKHNSILSIALVVLLTGNSLKGQIIKNPFDKNKNKEVEPAVEQKNAEEFYQEMKDFAEGLYNKPQGEGDKRDSDFKKRVDSQYENLKRANAQRAYERNTSAKSEVKYVLEDRFRVFSGLYDNLLVQDLLNRTGQSVIPKSNDHLYTFKLIADPIPSAETLATGTIYVTTGLVALLNTKAELAYVLAHEAAHVYRGHFKTEIMINLAAEEYAAKNKAKLEEIQKRIAIFSALGGGAIGAIGGRSVAAGLVGAVGGYAVGAISGEIVMAGQQPKMYTDWNRIQEDEADELALRWVISAKQDVDEIPKVYQALKDAGDRDDRVTLGFLGRSNRVRERAKRIEQLIDAERKKGTLAKVAVASDPDFDILLAEVKRDNGILAYEYDMLDTARENLGAAVQIKKNDPTALYFYAKILQETAKSDEERTVALAYYRQAAENDHRHQNYGANLHKAVALLKPDATGAEKKQAIDLLKQYLIEYYVSALETSETSTYLPPHLETIYDYMSRLGEYNFVVDQDELHKERAKMIAGRVSQVKYEDASTVTPKPKTVPVNNKK
jgi:predicted Zn-dependent protease